MWLIQENLRPAAAGWGIIEGIAGVGRHEKKLERNLPDHPDPYRDKHRLSDDLPLSTVLDLGAGRQPEIDVKNAGRTIADRDIKPLFCLPG